MIKVQLHGPLATGYDKPMNFDVHSPLMLFRGLECNAPEFTQRLREFGETGGGMSIICIDKEGQPSSVDPRFLHVPFGEHVESVHIVPEVEGAGIESAAAAIVAWIGVSAAYVGVATIIVTIALNVAIGLVLGAIASALAPSPDTSGNGNERPSERASLIFNGPVNTTAQGGVIPVVYGEHITGSVQISVGVNVEDIPPPVVDYYNDHDGDGRPDDDYNDGYAF